jgi:hypothetical protein
VIVDLLDTYTVYVKRSQRKLPCREGPSVAGTEALDGTSFAARPARRQDWFLSLGISVVALAAGLVIGRMVFLAL